MEQVKCAIYARYSSDNQREASIEDQVRRCKEFAASKGWEVLEDYALSDKGISGQSLRGRNGLEKLIEIGKSGQAPFNYILVDDTARVARNTRQALQIFEDLKFHNVFVFYVSQGIDGKSDSAGMMLAMHGIVDSQQIQSISKTTHRGVEGQFLAGFSTGGKRYGYRSSPKFTGTKDIYGVPEVEGYILGIESKEAEVVREIYHLFGELEYSATQIADMLNTKFSKHGEPNPPRGKFWQASAISGSRRNNTGILNNPIYIGQRYWNRSKTKKNPNSGAKISEKRMPSEWKYMEVPELRIVSDDLWQKVKARQGDVAKRSQKQFRKAKKIYSSHLLTGLTKCAECGGTFGIVSGGKYFKYGCTTNWNRGESACSNRVKIDGRILEENVAISLDHELTDVRLAKLIHVEFTSNLKSYIQSHHEREGAPANTQERIVLLEKSMKHIIEVISLGQITTSLHAALQKAEVEKAELKNRLSLASADVLDKVMKIISEEDIRFYLVKVADDLAKPNMMKTALEAILGEILVDCRESGRVSVKLVEKLDKTAEYLLDLLYKRHSRIRCEAGSRFTPYTSHIWQFLLTTKASSESTGFPGKTYFLETGIYEKGKSK